MSVRFGKYRIVKTENYDKYLEILEVNYFLRKIANTISATEELKKTGENSYEYNTESTFKCQYLKFNDNEEFIEETMDGRKVKCLFYFEGNKLIQIQKAENKKKELVKTRVEREFIGDEMIATYKVDDVDVVAKRFYKAVE